MIDLHTHTIFSDGALIPAELIRRAVVKGYQALALTDHADASNLDLVIPRLIRAGSMAERNLEILVIPGIELTHLPPAYFAEAVVEARRLGAALVLAHGETLLEPVAEGTNRAAIEAGVDILAHPGLITEEEAALAAEKGVVLEISTRPGHALANGHLLAMARRSGARLVIDNDAHLPGDLLPPEMVRRVGLGAGMSEKEISAARATARELAVLARRRMGRTRPNCGC